MWADPIFRLPLWQPLPRWVLWVGKGVLLSWLLLVPLPQSYSYSSQYQPLLLLDFYAGLGNLASRDQNEIPNNFVFSNTLGLTRFSLMPQAHVKAVLILRNSFLLKLEIILNNLRNQQASFSLGLGNEYKGFLLGLTQEYTLASLRDPNTLGMGIYSKVFYNRPGVMDLQFEVSYLGNQIWSGRSNSYHNIFIYLQTLFMVSQLRIGLIGTMQALAAISTGPVLIQLQGKILFGGSAPLRFFALDLYLTSVVIINQSLTENNYSMLFFGIGINFFIPLQHRVTLGFFFEILPFGIQLSRRGSISKDATGFTFGINLRLRVSRKELWSPELIPRNQSRYF